VNWLEHPTLKWALPIPVWLALAPLIWRAFGSTWRTLEAEALVERQARAATDKVDLRPAVALVIAAFVLMFQQYFGRSVWFDANVVPWLKSLCVDSPGALHRLEVYADLYGRLWWGGTRVLTYTAPLWIWKLLYRDENVLDMGLRVRGFREHAWIYAACVVVMVPLLVVVSRQPDFGRFYPIGQQAGRSWVDFAGWEVIYVAQFLGLEIFFRGWWIRATRTLGVAAIFCMAVPYAMIHFAKPYFESAAAVVAAVVLGSLSFKTRSIWAGFLVHATVGVLMDILALARRAELPSLVTPGGTRRAQFLYWDHILWGVWLAALTVVAIAARAYLKERGRTGANTKRGRRRGSP